MTSVQIAANLHAMNRVLATTNALDKTAEKSRPDQSGAAE
jgi:hypothetical protein